MARRSERAEALIAIIGEDGLSAVAAKIEKSLVDVGKSARGAGKSTERMSKSLLTASERAALFTTGLNASIALLGQAAQLAGKIGRAMKEAGESRGIEAAFSRKFKDAQHTMEALRASVAGQIDDTQLQRLASTASNAGLSLSQITKTLNLATKAAIGSGQDQVQTAQAMILSITRGTDSAFKRLGINVDTQQLFREQAETLGISTAELTAQQKSALVLQAASEATASAFGEIDISTGVQAATAQMAADLSNAKDSWGRLLADAGLYATEVVGVTKSTSTARQEQTAMVRQLVDGVSDARDRVQKYREAWIQAGDDEVFGKLTKAQKRLADGFQSSASAAEEITGQLLQIARARAQFLNPAMQDGVDLDREIQDQLDGLLKQYGLEKVALDRVKNARSNTNEQLKQEHTLRRKLQVQADFARRKALQDQKDQAQRDAAIKTDKEDRKHKPKRSGGQRPESLEDLRAENAKFLDEKIKSGVKLGEATAAYNRRKQHQLVAAQKRAEDYQRDSLERVRQAEIEGLQAQEQAWQEFTDRRINQMRDVANTSLDMSESFVSSMSGMGPAIASASGIIRSEVTRIADVLVTFGESGQSSGAAWASAVPGMLAASGQLAAGFISDTQDRATVMALFETAAGIASLASQDYVGGAMHLVSAGLYGAVAGGAFGGGAGASGAGGRTAGPPPPPPKLTSPDSGKQKEGTTVINIHMSGSTIIGSDEKKVGRDLSRILGREMRSRNSNSPQFFGS